MFLKRGWYFDADKGGNSGGGNPPEPTGDGSGANDQAKTYTQADLDRMFSERAAQAKSSMLKALGFESEKDAKEALSRLKSIEDGQKTELQKAQEKLLELERKTADYQRERQEYITRSEVRLTAAGLGIIDPDAAYKLLDLTKIEYDDNGNPKNVEQALKDLVKERPYLMGGGTSASNRARNHDNIDPVVIAARKAAGLPVTEEK